MEGNQQTDLQCLLLPLSESGKSVKRKKNVNVGMNPQIERQSEADLRLLHLR